MSLTLYQPLAMKPKLIISGGGTGGHIFPALAIADEVKIQFPEASILFVGAYNRMEMHLSLIHI